MTTYIAARMPTKKAFRDAVKAGFNVTLMTDHVCTLRDLHDRIGYSFTVTNARRQWFAEVTVKADRKLMVK